MSRQIENKLNRLLTKWPGGTVAVYQWLKKEGIYRQLADRYVTSGWLTRIGKGAFVRLGEHIEWTGGLYAIQSHMNLPVHVSGITALHLQGYAHFIPLGPGSNVHLTGTPGTRLPKWFSDHPWMVNIKYKTSFLFDEHGNKTVTAMTRNNHRIITSIPERAIMECLMDVPDEESFEHAALLMEGLTTLRPGITQLLLESCRSIKVKRLFLFLADYCNHIWLEKLDVDKLHLGSGKRMIEKNGQLDPAYLITVPKAFFNRKSKTHD